MDESLMFTAIAMANAIDPNISIKSALCLEYTDKWEDDELVQLDRAIIDYTKHLRTSYWSAGDIILFFEFRMEEIKK